MTRWLTIALTLIGFTIAMSAVGWVVNATVPGVHGWLIANLGQAGFWAVSTLVLTAAALFAWHDHRKADTSPKGV